MMLFVRLVRFVCAKVNDTAGVLVQLKEFGPFEKTEPVGGSHSLPGITTMRGREGLTLQFLEENDWGPGTKLIGEVRPCPGKDGLKKRLQTFSLGRGLLVSRSRPQETRRHGDCDPR